MIKEQFDAKQLKPDAKPSAPPKKTREQFDENTLDK